MLRGCIESCLRASQQKDNQYYGLTDSITDVVYAIRISALEYTGLKIMDVKIGKSTDIDNTLSQYSRGNRNIQLIDMWEPNPHKTLSTTERGIQAVAEQYAYDRQSEKFVFLQGEYQEFSETVNKLVKNVTRDDLKEDEEPCKEALGRRDISRSRRPRDARMP